ncbi:MAG: hypothetical protein IJ733_11355 [Lachnospiraceae bacterium]|nr:hypothetical protein [Lachnospiraceae bacterium]
MQAIKTITVDDKQYECKRYTYEELSSMFYWKVVVLEDPIYKDMNLVSGILVEVGEPSEKDKLRIKCLKTKDRKLTVWSFSPAPILVGYKELV